ncbi:MAG TPA: DEAD/DEAH box helicase [Caproicibacter sp.]|nr:DEAD/DEAH box helicase [Caproicibacter sp.]
MKSAAFSSDANGQAEPQQLSLFATEQEQIESISATEDEKSSAFLISQADVTRVLLQGSGVKDGKLRVYAWYQHQHSEKDTVDFIRHEYGTGGSSFTFSDGSAGEIQHDAKGIEITHGFHTADPDFRLSWKSVSKQLHDLVLSGKYLTPEEQIYYEEKFSKDLAATAQTHASPKVERSNIDVALQEWNGSIESKHAVVRYLEAGHSGKEAVAFLRAEYGDDLPSFPVTVGGTVLDLPWAKVYQRISRLIQNDRFYTDEEQNNFDNIDPIAIREKLAKAELENHPFVRQVFADVERLSDGDKTAPPLSGQPITRTGDTITIGSGDATHEIDVTLSDEQWSALQRAIPDSTAFPLPYKVGDTVYLDNKPFEITDIGNSDIQLRDPTLAYPIFRAESRENFERLLCQDTRNGAITEFLASNLEHTDADLREALTSGLLEQRDKENIAGYFRENEGNTRVAQRLSDTYAGISETVDLTTGDTADISANTIGFEVDIHDKYNSKRTASWKEISPILRALYQQEKDGFFHESAQREPVNLEGEPSYQVGDHAVLNYGGQELSGTVGFVGKKDVRIDTGPYSWSHEVINRDAFERGIRQDERNSSLFTPIQPATENFRITDDHLGEGGQKTKFGFNIQAIRKMKQIEGEGRSATPEEQEILSRYVGWGGIPQAFDPNNTTWQKEYSILKELLTEDEYTAARASVLNAHYTSPTVIKAIYSELERMGFKTGNILEPSCGVGNFLGLMPESMGKSKLYGVELDSVTGRIATHLYPKASITVNGFEHTDFPDDFFDLAVGNVPFGSYQLADQRYDRYKFLIHDYFFAKSIDKVRPGGLIVFLTSKGTLDKKKSDVRRYIAQRANLLGAVRLPNTAFLKNAGTEVTTDILFLQKRDRLSSEEPEWLEIRETKDGVPINQYFLEHPQMMLGTMAFDKRMYGNATETTCVPNEGADFEEELRTALSFISMPNQMILTIDDIPDHAEKPEQREPIPADPSVRNYSYTLAEGELYFRENSVMNPVDLPATTLERVCGMIELRDSTRKLIDLQMNSADDEAIRDEQIQLNTLYDAFSKKFGLINSTGNRKAFEKDSSYCLLCSLEILDEKGDLKQKADMFTKRTIRQKKAITSVKSASEALAASLSEKGCVDLNYMSSLLGGGTDKVEKIITDLQGVIFKDPAAEDAPFSGWQTADEYLSGNVRRKLEIAREAAKSDPDFAVNVASLEKVQPKDLTASEISIRLGANWIDTAYIDQFMYETFDTPVSLQNEKGIRVLYSPATGVWNITEKNRDSYNNVQVYTTFGTNRINAYKILEDTLNLRTVRIFDKKVDPDGKERLELNPKETAMAQQKQDAIKQEFQEWIWKDPDRREILCDKYNLLFNSTRPREYDGSHLTFPGMNPEIKLEPHQVNAVARGLYGKNTLLAHCVGAGKTFEMIAIAMKSKQIGLCHKSIFAVPNHLTEQWGADFLRLYPGANILVSTKKDFEPANRKKFCARIATGDYDAVILGYSQFEKIPVSKERQIMMIQNQIDDIEMGIDQAKQEKGDNFTIKQMEKTKRNLLARLERLNNDSRKDNVVTFEELGIDRLFVDEADNYKNLFLYTKMRNVAGIGQTEAQKSSDMFMKCRYMDELTDDRGITFATGTPVSNSMTELYTMMRYLQYRTLQGKDLLFFDNWAATFGETVTAAELAPEGNGYRTKTRFARFFNLPELINLWKEAADIQTSDMLHLPVPDVEYVNVLTKPSQFQKDAIQEIGERADAVHKRIVEPQIDNMLKITNDGRLLALDQRLINPALPDDPGSKVNACVKNILDVWRKYAPDKGAQLVFCDLSTPKSKMMIQMEMVDGVAQMVEGQFDDYQFTDVYNDIRLKLIQQGIPENEIEFIHCAKTEAQKAELFAKVRSGQIRVLLGSTAKMGAGTNVQDLLIAEHELTCPWKPRDIEQAEGRIIRKGNKFKKVLIFRYLTENTFDSYSWQLIENKQKFISQIMTSKSPARSCEDIDDSVLTYAEVKALATGDPRIKEKMNLDVEVSKLKMLKSGFLSQHYVLEDKLIKFYPEEIQNTKALISDLEADLKYSREHPVPDLEHFTITIKGMTYTDKKEAGMALIKACGELNSKNDTLNVGTYCGFSVQLHIASFSTVHVILKNNATHSAEIGTDPVGNITRMNNILKTLPQRVESEQKNLEMLNRQVGEAEEELKKPFSKEQELEEKSERLNQLTLELNCDHPDIQQSLEKEDEDLPAPLNERIKSARQSIVVSENSTRAKPPEIS